MPRSFNSKANLALGVAMMGAFAGVPVPKVMKAPTPVEDGRPADDAEPKEGHSRPFYVSGKTKQQRRAANKRARAARKISRPMYRSGKAKHQ